MKRLVFTFDDGLRSHYELVGPLLRHRGLTGTFFIPGNRDLWRWHRNPDLREDGLTWREIAELHQDGFEIANHTLNHMRLTGTDREAIVAQITQLDAQFEAHDVPRPISFCYPGYWCDNHVMVAVKSTHIKFARTGYVNGDLLPNHHESRPELRHYVPGMTDPHCVYCTGILNSQYPAETFIADLEATPDGCVAVFAAHGFRSPRQWEMFVEMIDYVVDRGYETMNMRELPTELTS